MNLSHHPIDRTIATSCVLLAAVSLGFAGCGSAKPARTASARVSAPSSMQHHHHHRVNAGRPDPTRLVVTADDYSFETDQATVRPGPLRVVLHNEGSEAHQVQIGRTDGHLTPDQFVDLYHREGDLASVRALTWVGGVSVIDPGERSEATVELPPGDYLLVCYVPAPDGISHVMKGMVASLHVTGSPIATADSAAGEGTGDAGRAGRTGPVATVTLSDYHIELPTGFRGRGEVAFRNNGHEPHEVVFMRLDDGKTLADAAAYQADSEQPAPFSFAAGIASIAPGTRATADLDLEPGDYIATCFVPGPGPGHEQHIALGMLTTFTVH